MHLRRVPQQRGLLEKHPAAGLAVYHPRLPSYQELSYRREKLPGRAMTKEEVRWVREMARRIAAILLMEPALDENYRAVKAHTYEWPKQA
jgi:hypothetical protein